MGKEWKTFLLKSERDNGVQFLNVLDVTSRTDLSGVVREKTSTHRHTEKLAQSELGSLMEKPQPLRNLAYLLYRNPKMHMNVQNNMNSQRNLRDKEQY